MQPRLCFLAPRKFRIFLEPLFDLSHRRSFDGDPDSRCIEHQTNRLGVRYEPIDQMSHRSNARRLAEQPSLSDDRQNERRARAYGASHATGLGVPSSN
jgi:hypothetical protein